MIRAEPQTEGGAQRTNDVTAMPANGFAKIMANDMREVASVKGSVETEDLVLRGWTQAQIETHGAEARRMAQIDSIRRTEGNR
ncbi:hypothetical protein [Notoacmeibacter sp. MSK16QG-6]|uniref:hypothetical protein n=1 Tax=Notoacmeibacter sp. MSK16QG-6 TaxID=2957982 RepID=UPI00209F5231|nr:hypothetical protein [Notoacmeibacter sp. MSK16QG-6]MCP1200088.1 hypothetical protein [Notoacmeibacter sp. MSK16QG-6]